MFSKPDRLKDSKLFQKAFLEGKPFFFQEIGCKVLFLASEPKRIGFAVSKKIFPRAVDRNAAKRRLSLAAKEQFLGLSKGIQLVFFFRNATLDRSRMQESVHSIFEKIQSDLKK